MPLTTQVYFRARRLFSREQYRHPKFREMVEADKEMLRLQLPKDCSEELLWNTFEHADKFIKGAWVVNYFESEDELMAYKAVHYKDASIYKDYVKNRLCQE